MLTKRRLYEFGDFRVDTGQFLLSKAGHAQPITPTVFRILQILLDRAGEVVTKEELMKYVWPDSYVEEGNLNRNMSTLRKALDEKPSDHRYIETIPKTGYRFITSVRAIDYQPPAGVLRKATSRHEIVGRELERETLRRAYEQAQQGTAGIVCISGDVGLGKTALVDTWLDDLANDGQTFHLARCRCSEPLTESEPYMPWIEALTSLAQEPTVSEIMMKAAPGWHREISHTGSAVLRSMKRELLDFCRQVSVVHPLILVIDDFHWSDAASADLLAFLASRLESSHVLVVVCYRGVEMKIKSHPFLRVRAELLSRGPCTEIQLTPLDREHIEEICMLENGSRRARPNDTDLLYAKSDGNPLFFRELMRGEEGRLSDSFRQMIQAGIDRLDDTHRQLLVTASVQGREFDSAVLSSTVQVASQDVEESLQELDETYGLIQRIRDEDLGNGRYTVRYRFVYALYHEACYASLAPTRKASLSASLAEAFLTYYGN